MITLRWFFGEKDDLTDARTIRHAVFIDEQGISEAEEYDGSDAACVHLVAYLNDTPTATGRIMILSGDYLIGRIAVLREHRGKRLGELIMQQLVNACCEMGSERQVVHSQISARGFYEKLGFTAFGDEYDDAGIPHISMEHFGGINKCEGCEAAH